MQRILLLYLCVICAVVNSGAQVQMSGLAILDSGQDCSIRGMSIPSDRIVWVSGSNGHVGRSADGGKTWQWILVPGYEKVDFRDIHAFDSSSAIIMGIGNPGYILKTRDGGDSWKLVFTKDAPGLFLDAMDFRNGRDGICIGDPIEDGSKRKTFFVIRTTDGGDTWQQSESKLPAAGVGEAVFSASGTNIVMLPGRRIGYAFISGGLSSNLYLIRNNGKQVKVLPLPLRGGKESTGAFSLAISGEKMFYCIGGDYKDPQSKEEAFVWTTDGGDSWKTPTITPPAGYRSCIRIINGEKLIACGPNGVDVCDNPNKWKHISDKGFNVCMVSPSKRLVFLAGSKGLIGKLRL